MSSIWLELTEGDDYILSASNSNIMSIITTTLWVPRGFAAPFPKKYDLNEDEFERIAELAKLQLEQANEDLAASRAQKSVKDDSSVEDNGQNREEMNTLGAEK